jgi:hypothetical protein
MAIANGLSLPNPLSNGTTNDAVPVMADFNYLLGALNRALLDAGGGAGMNAQSTQIHNLANGTAANDAVNLSQLGGYALLAGATFTGSVGFTQPISTTSITASGLIIGNAGFSGTTLNLSGAATISGLMSFGSFVTCTANGTGFQLTDASGSHPLLAVDGSNNLTLYGTNATGAALALFMVGVRNNSPTFAFNVPVSLAALTATGALSLTGALTPGTAANSVGYLGAPQNLHTASYTLALTDASIAQDFNGASLTCTFPANASVAFPVGTIIPITNLNASNLAIAITSDTLTLAGTTSTGSRTLSQNGVATARKVTATSWIISGAGLS